MNLFIIYSLLCSTSIILILFSLKILFISNRETRQYRHFMYKYNIKQKNLLLNSWEIPCTHLGAFIKNTLKLNSIDKLFNSAIQLGIKEEIFKKYIEQIKTLILDKNIGRFDLTASIDGWGEEAEYARTGLKIEHFIKLFNYVVDQKWIFFKKIN